ncbi:glycosyltransferase family 2 protein [Erythrobacter sp. T5W1-R]|uniref:glycosyltransferase family 2 protein n=1 Tax=Erythrobacter sp. T5W1-R TaxID=3101752 RepID=UPI002AFEEDAB|nr:glycosyltransferase family 2 protein [Erythrobacter sp. T5W1-R]MEA1619904.1 glycosyltransferase family 2 protein [Erythrobacter sp. T5W1-R]
MMIYVRTLFRIHLEALFRFPSAYMMAVAWLILGKRLRARGHFARLLGQTSLAYRWWVQKQTQVMKPSPPSEPPIIVLIDGEATALPPDETLASLLSEGLSWNIIGPDASSDITQAARDIDWSASPCLMVMAAGDKLALGSAECYRIALKSNATSSAIFSDDDLVDAKGIRSSPHFKPGWNSELFRHHDYLTGSCIVRADEAMLAEAAKQPNWDSWLVNEAIRRGSVAHIPAVLHHRASRQPAPREVQPLTIADTLPSVSVIIPTRNRADLLRTCIAGLRATDYPNLEIIIADNDSDDPETLAYFATLAQQGITILPQPGPFNYSTINNNAVAIAQGEFICLMNNDMEILKPDWLAIMVTQAMRPEVGAVGAQLLYPDGRIQHAGVVIGVGNAAGHAHKFLRPEDEGYFRRHALPQYVSAVTAACLVVRKDKFLAVGGLDDKNFAVAFNDVDLCLKLNKQGWQSFYEPRAVLVHHESISRGHDKDPVGAARFAKELAALQRIWRTDEIIDPYHHPNLSRASEQFAISLTL